MIYAVMVLGGAAVLALAAATTYLRAAPLGPGVAMAVSAPLAWSAIHLFIVGLGYVVRTLELPGPHVALVGKDERGGRAAWSWLIAGFYIGFLRSVRIIQSLYRTEPAYNLVAPGIYVGRRVDRDELPDDVGVVVDLAAELSPGAGLIQDPAIDYRSVPSLDGLAPDTSVLRTLMDRLERDERPIYFHCAAGHGRSATAAAALMVRRGLASDPVNAITLMRAARPKVKLGRVQARAAQAAGHP